MSTANEQAGQGKSGGNAEQAGPPPASSRLEEHQELDQNLSAARLEGRMLWAGVLLVVSLLAPYEVIIGHPQFLWQVWGELGGVARLAALAPSLAGVFLLFARPFELRAANRAVLCFAALAGVLVLTFFGAEASAWDVLSVPEVLGDRPLFLLAPFACAGAGATLIGRGSRQRALGKNLLMASALLALPLYLIPLDGSIPLFEIAKLLLIALSAEEVRFALGYSWIALTALIPALIAGAALLLARVTPRQELVILPLLMTYAMPLALALFVVRQFLATLGGLGVVASALNLLPLVAGLGVSAAALEVLVGGQRPSRRTGWSAAGALSVLSVALWLASRPPDKGISWKLRPASEQADRVFGESLARWNQARRGWGVRAKAEQAASASEYVKVRQAATDLLKEARGVDAAVVAPLQDLVFETRDPGLAGRRWFRLVAELNEANRALGLPYYVDPTVDFFSRQGDVKVLFDLQPYRIESVHPYFNDGKPLATLRVSSLGDKRRNHSLLGFSRDIQPFALVALDVVRPYVERLESWSEMTPPSCFGRSADVDPLLAFCGERLRALRQEHGGLDAITVASTERHELQHQIDGPGLPLPSEVHDRMGPYFSWARDDVNRELSAQLAEMTATEGSAALSLLQVFGSAYNGRPRGKYTHSSVLVLEALVDAPLPGAGGTDRELSREVVADAYRELAALSEPELQHRARQAWERLYGSELARPIPQ